MFRYLVFVALIVGGCSSPHELAKCRGPLIVLNTDHWRPTAADVAALSQLCPEDK